jgi:hypothetical protein
MSLEWGQPDGGVTQFAYFVEDIEVAAADFTAHLGVGPWFVRGPFRPPEGRLRGVPNGPLISLTRGFSGHAMFELVQQHDDGPSVFHEHGGPRSYGFHHWAVVTSRFDAHVARLLAEGYEEAVRRPAAERRARRLHGRHARPARDDRARRAHSGPGGGLRRDPSRVGHLGRHRPDPAHRPLTAAPAIRLGDGRLSDPPPTLRDR